MPIFPRHCILRVIICLSREGFSLGNICGVVLFICLKEGNGGEGGTINCSFLTGHTNLNRNLNTI